MQRLSHVRIALLDHIHSLVSQSVHFVRMVNTAQQDLRTVMTVCQGNTPAVAMQPAQSVQQEHSRRMMARNSATRVLLAASQLQKEKQVATSVMLARFQQTPRGLHAQTAPRGGTSRTKEWDSAKLAKRERTQPQEQTSAPHVLLARQSAQKAISNVRIALKGCTQMLKARRLALLAQLETTRVA